MKTTAKNLGILFYIIGIISIIGIFLISGCIGEKPEEKQVELTELEKKQTELEKKQTELEKKQAELEKKQTELEKKFAEEINKTEPETKELEEDSDWCNATAAKKYSAGSKTMWTEGIVEFKGKPMCHLIDLIIGVNGTTKYEWYFTENEEEVYRVITYPDGRVEETKVI